jgi:hypothetical protein
MLFKSGFAKLSVLAATAAIAGALGASAPAMAQYGGDGRPAPRMYERHDHDRMRHEERMEHRRCRTERIVTRDHFGHRHVEVRRICG